MPLQNGRYFFAVAQVTDIKPSEIRGVDYRARVHRLEDGNTDVILSRPVKHRVSPLFLRSFVRKEFAELLISVPKDENSVVTVTYGDRERNHNSIPLRPVIPKHDLRDHLLLGQKELALYLLLHNVLRVTPVNSEVHKKLLRMHKDFVAVQNPQVQEHISLSLSLSGQYQVREFSLPVLALARSHRSV